MIIKFIFSLISFAAWRRRWRPHSPFLCGGTYSVPQSLNDVDVDWDAAVTFDSEPFSPTHSSYSPTFSATPGTVREGNGVSGALNNRLQVFGATAAPENADLDDFSRYVAEEDLRLIPSPKRRCIVQIKRKCSEFRSGRVGLNLSWLDITRTLCTNAQRTIVEGTPCEKYFL